MKKTTLHHLVMYQNVLAVVKDHQSTWSGIPGMAGARMAQEVPLR